MPRISFRDLPIGARFEFASVEDFPHSGLERGPWTKMSARRYHKGSGSDTMVCRVGSIHVAVIPLAVVVGDKPPDRTGPGQIAQVDVDEAEYVGDGEDGVYVQAAKGRDGWYVSSIVDSNSGSFVDAYITDDGPYPTEAEAMVAGICGAMDWCLVNDVEHDIEYPVTYPVKRRAES